MILIKSIEVKEYKAAIYIRLSKEDGDKEESESVTNQRKILESFANENNYKIYDEYIDDGYSGTNFNRPDFKRMINDIENKKINMVITKSLSRLGRDYIEMGRYIESYFPENDIRYIAILDDVDTYLDRNCDTVAFKNIMNDFYAKETSKNVKKTKNKKKLEGFYYTSYAPFGYRKVSKSGRLEIDEVQAKIVKKIYDLFLEGKGTYKISKILTEEGIKTPGLQMEMKNITNVKDEWNHNTVRRILENQIYIGNCVQNKSRKISYKSKKIIKNKPEEYTITKNHHTGIISIDKWQLVQKMLENHKDIKVKETDVLFKDFLYCADCNKKLQVRKKINHNKSGDKVVKYILCNNKNCLSNYIKYDEFEKNVLFKISQILKLYINSNDFKNETTLNRVYMKQNNKEIISKRIEKLNKDLEKTNKKINTLYTDRLNGLLEQQDFKLFSVNLINQRNEIKKILEKSIDDLEKINEDKIFYKLKIEMQKFINELSECKKITKDIINELINKIEIDKEKKVIIYFNFRELSFK